MCSEALGSLFVGLDALVFRAGSVLVNTSLELTGTPSSGQLNNLTAHLPVQLGASSLNAADIALVQVGSPSTTRESSTLRYCDVISQSIERWRPLCGLQT